jgi:hypothetical protein
MRIAHDDLWEEDWEEYKSISVFELDSIYIQV